MSRIFLTLALLAAVQSTLGVGLFNGFGGGYYYEGGEGGEGGESESSESESSESESSSDPSDSSTCTPCGPIENGQCCDDCPRCADPYAICKPHLNGGANLCDCCEGYTLCEGRCVPSDNTPEPTTTTTPEPTTTSSCSCNPDYTHEDCHCELGEICDDYHCVEMCDCVRNNTGPNCIHHGYGQECQAGPGPHGSCCSPKNDLICNGTCQCENEDFWFNPDADACCGDELDDPCYEYDATDKCQTNNPHTHCNEYHVCACTDDRLRVGNVCCDINCSVLEKCCTDGGDGCEPGECVCKYQRANADICCGDCGGAMCCTDAISELGEHDGCDNPNEVGTCFCPYDFAIQDDDDPANHICCAECDEDAGTICCTDINGCQDVSAGTCYCANGFKPDGINCCPTLCGDGQVCNQYGTCEDGNEPGDRCGPAAPSCNLELGIKCHHTICCMDGEPDWPECNEKFCVCNSAHGFKWVEASEACVMTTLTQSELKGDCETSIGPRSNLNE